MSTKQDFCTYLLFDGKIVDFLFFFLKRKKETLEITFIFITMNFFQRLYCVQLLVQCVLAASSWIILPNSLNQHVLPYNSYPQHITLQAEMPNLPTKHTLRQKCLQCFGLQRTKILFCRRSSVYHLFVVPKEIECSHL